MSGKSRMDAAMLVDRSAVDDVRERGHRLETGFTNPLANELTGVALERRRAFVPTWCFTDKKNPRRLALGRDSDSDVEQRTALASWLRSTVSKTFRRMDYVKLVSHSTVPLLP
jgi:hypothetical protein